MKTMPPEIPGSTNTSSEKKDSYKSIIKGVSFFGGVQIFNIIINFIRGKFVAIILGPSGMGISSLFNSASGTIQRVSSLGLNQAIVRDVANDSNQTGAKDRAIHTSILLTNLTAILGLIICVIFCVPLSKLTFGDSSYAWQFILLGAAVAFGIAGNGKLAVLQGLHQVKRISKASVVGGLTGLIVGVPLYYFFGDKGIVPAIVAVFLSLYVFYSVNLSKVYKFSKKEIFKKELIPVAKNMLLLGVVLMSGDLIANLVTYLINLFIRSLSSLEEVGLYQAAHSVTYQYAGVVFAAMAMDYFPRLSKIASDNVLLRETVNRQSEIVAWFITPAMALLILSTPLLIEVLLAESFHQITPLMRWMGLGILFRAFSFPMAYITFAKGNKKVFFILEGLCANILTLLISCICFYFFGLIGLGYALVVDNALCFVIYYIVNNRLYNYRLSSKAIVSFLIGAGTVSVCFIASYFPYTPLSYSIMGIFATFSIIWSVMRLKSKFRY